MKSIYTRMAAGFLAVILLCHPVEAAPAHAAQSAVLMDGATGRVLYAYQSDRQAQIASTTKIMTGLLIAEECDLDALVAVPPEAVGVEGSSMHLQAGEILSVEALLYGMMLHSGNDAAVTLAMYCAGSVPAFAERMNQKAADLGLTGSHFVNPHGLDAEGHYATAYDLALLTARAMQNPIFSKVVSTKEATFDQRHLVNHNKLLWRYEGAVGVKTGYTKSAGRVLVSAAERDGRRLIAVTIDDPDDWRDHEALLDYGFSSYHAQELVTAGQIMGSVPVISGAEPEADVIVAADASYPVMGGEQIRLRLSLPEFVYAPVLAGDEAGSMDILLDGHSVMTLPLYWRYSVLEEA